MAERRQELAMGITFGSWADVLAYVEWLRTHRFHPLVRQRGKSVKEYNKRVKLAAKIDEKWVMQCMRFQCSHFGSHVPRRSASALTERCQQKVYKCGCQFFFRVVFDKNSCEFRVTDLNLQHVNHPIGPDFIKLYKRKGQITKEMMDELILALQLGGKTDRIRNHFLEKGGVYLKPKDLINMRLKLKGISKSDWVSIRTVLGELCEGGCDVRVTVSEESGIKTLSTIFIQSAEQKKLFASHGSVLLLDATYGTNDLGMPLFTLCVTDRHGKGQPVASFYTKDECINTNKICLQYFAQVNDISKVVAIITDKDAKEIGALREVFPAARLVLCWFHIFQAVNRNIASVEVNLRHEISDAFRTAVFTHSEDVLMEQKKYLCSLDESGLADYFRTTWFGCVESWAYHHRQDLALLGNNTTNRLERLHRTIKEALNGAKQLPHVIRTIAQLSDARIRDCKMFGLDLQLRKTVDRPCVLLEPFADIISPRIFELMQNEASSPKTAYASHTVSNRGYEVTTRKFKYSVDASLTKCSCNFFVNYQVPCRHLLYMAAIHYQELNPAFFSTRWNITDENNYAAGSGRSTVVSTVKVVDERNLPKTNSSNTFEEASVTRPEEIIDRSMVIFRKVAETISMCPTTVADGYINFIVGTHGRMQTHLKELDIDLSNRKLPVISIPQKKKPKKIESPEETFTRSLEMLRNVGITLSFFPPVLAIGYMDFFGRANKNMKANLPLESFEGSGEKGGIPQLRDFASISKSKRKLHISNESNEIGDSMQDGGIHMPQKGRRAGRPKKQKGMNSFKKVEKAFWDQSRKKKISAVLNWTVRPEFRGHKAGKFTADMLMERFTDIDNAILEPEVKLEEFIGLFDAGAWAILSDFVAEKRKKKIKYLCGICHLDIGKKDSVRCDSCLVWLHFTCAGFGKSAPKSTKVFCKLCRN